MESLHAKDTENFIAAPQRNLQNWRNDLLSKLVTHSQVASKLQKSRATKRFPVKIMQNFSSMSESGEKNNNM